MNKVSAYQLSDGSLTTDKNLALIDSIANDFKLTIDDSVRLTDLIDLLTNQLTERNKHSLINLLTSGKVE